MAHALVFEIHLEVRKNCMFQIAGGDEELSVWGIYIDNLTEVEIVPLAKALGLIGTTSPGMARADQRYLEWSSPGSDDKIVNRQPDRQVLVCKYSGYLGRVDTPSGFGLPLMCLTLWLLGQWRVPKRWMQVCAGR